MPFRTLVFWKNLKFYCTGNFSLINEIYMKWNSVGAEVGWCHDDCSDTGSAGIRQALPGKWHRSVPVPGCQELMESILKCKDCSVSWCIFSLLLPLSFCYIWKKTTNQWLFGAFMIRFGVTVFSDLSGFR